MSFGVVFREHGLCDRGNGKLGKLRREKWVNWEEGEKGGMSDWEINSSFLFLDAIFVFRGARWDARLLIEKVNNETIHLSY